MKEIYLRFIILVDYHLLNICSALIIHMCVLSTLQCNPIDYRTNCSAHRHITHDRGFKHLIFYLSLIVATSCDLPVIIVYHKCLSRFVYKRNVQFIA